MKIRKTEVSSCEVNLEVYRPPQAECRRRRPRADRPSGGAAAGYRGREEVRARFGNVQRGIYWSTGKKFVGGRQGASRRRGPPRLARPTRLTEFAIFSRRKPSPLVIEHAREDICRRPPKPAPALTAARYRARTRSK
ncbi:hypothetical protein EVAR_41329_1 [Eumeta japonica]|uniref:Uncharacterized protein n=1 Tax=Eumeta variegata TaxID=151549 RepID=A0A4C1X5F5_EUMVA|nr:hypothetical protein EVAR_41329_1 [Eumeta japonica]